MRPRFAEDDLRRLYEDPEFRIPRIGSEVAKIYRKRVGFLEAATDQRDIRAMKSLRLEALKGDRRGSTPFGSTGSGG